jgi:hypothetical protein
MIFLPCHTQNNLDPLFLLCFELLQGLEGFAFVHHRRAAPHQDSHSNRFRDFDWAGAYGEGVVNVKSDTAITADVNRSGQSN